MSTEAIPVRAAPPVTDEVPRISQGMLAMLLFIGSEVMLFAALFAAYFFARFNIADNVWPPVDPATGEPFELPILMTAVNTAFLVFSSFTVWWAEHRLMHGDRRGMIRGLWVTIMLGATFLIIQINEYAHLSFSPQDQAFGSTFYVLTGAHGLHVFVGLSLLTVMLIRAYRGDFSPSFATPLTAASAYWHFVDVVWVLLFILVYLL
ncbi:MAG: cytochrome c oxidase subunit 3 [Thermoleophilia bacterium]|nr:cytochrome c oxidase subunit 3 [Thermoleophilia bacterium]MDH3725319.1 cytochrome c oxidase subunit 3 [Thermoleophilia bacterium]